MHHHKDLERVAFVGDAKWQELATKMAGVVTHAVVRHYASEDAWIAWDFILDIG